MRRHHLIAGKRLVTVVARISERRLDGRLRRLRAHEEIDRHALPGPRPGAVERVVLPPILGTVAFPRGIFFTLCLTDAEREGCVADLAVPVVAEVEFRFARPEEIVRRRKRHDRSALPFGGDEAVGGLPRDALAIPGAA